MNQVKIQDSKLKNMIMFFCFFITLISSCKKNEKTDDVNKNNSMELSKIKEVIKKQLKNGTSEEYGSFDDYNLEDLNVLVNLESKILKNNGYNSLSDKEFSEKIELFFRRKIDLNSNSEFLKIDMNNVCDKKMDLKLQTADFKYIYVSKKNKFITDFWAIPQLINYERNYPELLIYESKTIFVTDEVEGTKIEIKQWKSMPNLEQQREKNIQILVNRNKYIFNDNKASLIWLKFNDKEFLESLVKKYGYTEDQELLKFVLDRNLKDSESFGQIIYIKDCLGKLVFNKKFIDLLNIAPRENQSKYLDAIYNYFEYLRDTPEKDLNLTFSERSEIQGKLAYYASKIAEKMTGGPYSYYSFFTFLSSEEDGKEFQKRNFYNIKDFQEVYEETKTGGVSYPGME